GTRVAWPGAVRAAGEAGVGLIAEPAEGLGRRRREALLVEGQVAPGFVVAGMEVGDHAAGEQREREAVPAVAERVVDVAMRAAHADRAHAIERDREQPRPAVRDRDAREGREVALHRGAQKALGAVARARRDRRGAPE